VAALDALLERVQQHLAHAEFAEAKAAADDAFSSAPNDERVRAMYANLNLAHGIRLVSQAVDRRAREIDERGRPGQPFEDSEAVQGIFRDALLAFDRVLAVDPDHLKALSLKAQALFRIDRGQRAHALGLYDEAARALERTLSDESARETARRNVLGARRRIETPCEWCDDTGFCPECTGSGWRTVLGFRRKCEACLGHGICKRCGVL